ncbi:MAG: hypothetical protein ACYC91_05690 [Solirubrobacteraceae bacterium]
MREKYAAAARAIAEHPDSSSRCGPVALTDADQARVFGASLFDGVPRPRARRRALSLESRGSGVPTAVADLQEGETVFDLGLGSRRGLLISSRRVGPIGKAIVWT